MWDTSSTRPSREAANCIAPETTFTDRNLARVPAPLQAELAQAHPIRGLESSWTWQGSDDGALKRGNQYFTATVSYGLAGTGPWNGTSK